VDANEAIQLHRESVAASVPSSDVGRRTFQRHPFLGPRYGVELGEAVPEVMARAEAW
jgi:hypothetical protein